MSQSEHVKRLVARRYELKRTLRRLLAEAHETRKALRQVKAEITKAMPRPRTIGGIRQSIRQALSERPMTTAELAAVLMIERGMDPNDKPRRFAVQHRIRASLDRLRRRGVVTTNAAGAPFASVWTLTRR